MGRAKAMNKKVRDVMGDSPVSIHTVSPGESVVVAVRRMINNSVGCLIVTNDNEYVGIITERDIARTLAETADMQQVTVDNVMTRMIRFVGPDDTLEHAIQIMRQKGFRHLPVFDKGEIIYVLSIRDIAFAEVDELSADVQILADHVFTWELNGEQRHFYKDVIGAKYSGKV